jgi:hypothetical protein
MSDMNTATIDEPRTRPSLLTVLCNLSFIWAGISIIGGIIKYASMKMMANGKFADMVAQVGDTSLRAQFEEVQAKVEAAGLNMDQMASAELGTVALAIVALIGVIMMWKLRRTGFFIYVAAQVIIFTLSLMMGVNLDMSWTSMPGTFFIALTFISLYAVNLKYMHGSSKMLDTTITTIGVSRDRPTLLTVICIISFIAGIWSLYGGISNLTMDPLAARTELEKKMSDKMSESGDKANEFTGIVGSAHAMGLKAIDNHNPIGIANSILSLISLIAVWQMWILKKRGFWLYVLATIAGIEVVLVYTGVGMGSAVIGIMVFYSLIFIILYAVNLKYMH